MKRSLRLTDCVLMILVAVIGLRWIASAAAGGPGSIGLWVLAMLFFFIPEGLTVADLSARFPQRGGIYDWTKQGMGDTHGFICGWCYWVNNLLYFPSLLIFVSANVAFVFNRLQPGLHLEESKFFVTTLTLICLWAVAILNFVGLKTGRWLQNCGAIATWIPATLLILLGFLAFLLWGSANSLQLVDLLPHLQDRNSLSFFSEMCFAFAGLELISMMTGEIQKPQRTVVRAVAWSGVAIAAVYMLGTMAVLVAVPQAEITTVNGVLLPIEQVASHFGLGFLALVSAALIAIGGWGGTMAWFAGASRVPYVVGVDAYLPKAFGRLHPTRQTPHIAIWVQAITATVFTLLATAGANTGVDRAYNILVDMCLILYFIPFVYLFLAAYRLRSAPAPREDTDHVFRIPGGVKARVAAAIFGLISTCLAIYLAVFPSSEIDPTYLTKTVGGSLLMIGVGLFFFWRGRSRLTSS